MFNPRRLYRTIEGLLLRLGGLIVLLLMLRPKWGDPGDFYLGYPARFYITQSDVAYSHVSVLWFLWDVILCGTPVFVVIFVLLCGVRRCPLFNHRLDNPPKSSAFRSISEVTGRVVSWRPSSTQIFLTVLVCVFIVGLFVPSYEMFSGSKSLGRAPVWQAYVEGIFEPAFQSAAIIVVAVHCAVSTVTAWGVDQLVGKRFAR